jgi:hypothetical protein
MKPGQRTHKQASARIVDPDWLPETHRANVREISALQSGNQRKGHATALMHQICAEADIAANTLVLLVDESDQEQAARLKKFYIGFGFNIAQIEPCIMLRAPQKPLIVSTLTDHLLKRVN